MDFPSSPSSGKIWKHDVFLSFRSEDTCNFTGRLLAALEKEGLSSITLRDETNTNTDRKLMIGESIPQHILKAIEQSRISIVVFSKNYAASTWCLEELAKIAEGINKSGRTVLPVFYDIDPYEVQLQSEEYEKAFAEHEERFKADLDKVQRWRLAMRQVSFLFGWNVRNMVESHVIDEIVKKAMSKLSPSIDVDELVGIQSRIVEVEKLLDLRSDVVRFVGIWGMGGFGKTTIAEAVYNNISHRFDASCFLADVRQNYVRNGLVYLQEQLLSETLKMEYINIRDVDHGTVLIRTRLRHYKTLIVLDDVDNRIILEALARNADWFGAGSRIIITSRHKHLLSRHTEDQLYKVQMLNNEEAFQLFCRNAFKSDYPMRGYKELTYYMVEHVGGVPLAIKSLASSLLYQSVPEWQSALDKLRRIPQKEILYVLKMSFDQLDEMDKEIFLDIACFFVGEKVDYVRKILRLRGFNFKVGILTLVNQSLMTLSNQRIRMHNLLQVMGREIVRQESPKEPGKRSRLWFYNDFRYVMQTNTGTKKVKAIILKLKDPEGPLRAESLSIMSRLRLLILMNIKFLGSLPSLSKELVYLLWDKYPFTSLPSNFQSDKLVDMILPNSNITELWQGIKIFPSLRSIHLSGSKNLIKTPNFRGVPNLERVELEDCTALSHLHPSIASLPTLAILNLRNCKSLVSIPNRLFLMKGLQVLNLAGSSKLAECLNFSPLKSSIEVKLLSNQYCPLSAKMLCYILFTFPEHEKDNNKLMFCCYIYVIYVFLRELGLVR